MRRHQCDGPFHSILNCAAALSEKGHDVTIITNGTDAMKKKATPMAEAVGVSMAYTDCGLDVEKDCLRKPKGCCGCEHTFNTMLKKWHPYVKDMLERIKPDIVVSDQVSCCGSLSAVELNIPVVINCPSPLKVFQMGAFDMISMGDTSSCC